VKQGTNLAVGYFDQLRNQLDEDQIRPRKHQRWHRLPDDQWSEAAHHGLSAGLSVFTGTSSHAGEISERRRTQSPAAG
jgi:hypothetical protein